MTKEIKKCCICGKGYTGFGNNAEPVAKGRCCNICNMYVVAARLSGINQKGGK